MSDPLDDVCELLNTHGGRDKFVRLACYTVKLYGCMKQDPSWQKASSELSKARLMLRLFDDVPTIRYALSYGLGRHETSRTSATLGVLSNVIDLIYLPVEKAYWLNTVGVLKLSSQSSEALDLLMTELWAASIYVALLRSVREIRQLWWSRDCIHKCTENRDPNSKKPIDTKILLQAITITKLSMDFVQAVSCLPKGYLWGERINKTKVSAIATISSLIGIALYFARKRLSK